MVKNLILSIIAIAILAGCSGKKDKTTDSDVVEAIPVKVQKLEKTDIARTLDYAANLEADNKFFTPLQPPEGLKKYTWKLEIKSKKDKYSLKWTRPNWYRLKFN